MDGCHAPVPQGMPGDGSKYTQGTGLLNIAGEKIACSGILGHSTVYKKENSRAVLFLCNENFLEIFAKFLLHFDAECDIIFRHVGH